MARIAVQPHGDLDFAHIGRTRKPSHDNQIDSGLSDEKTWRCGKSKAIANLLLDSRFLNTVLYAIKQRNAIENWSCGKSSVEPTQARVVLMRPR